MELSGKKINFLGDSITEGVGASAPDKVYHQVMLGKYGLAAARNYGISGTRYARQINQTLNEPRFDLDFCQRYAGMDDDADIVVVFGGTNDFGHGDAPIGTPDDRTPDTFWGACHYLYSHLIEKYPAALIVVMTPLHRLNEHFTNGDGHQKKYNYGNLKSYVDIIRTAAEYYGIPVLDLFANACIQPQIQASREQYTVDGLHPNDTGYAYIADRLANFILNY